MPLESHFPCSVVTKDERFLILFGAADHARVIQILDLKLMGVEEEQRAMSCHELRRMFIRVPAFMVLQELY